VKCTLSSVGKMKVAVWEGQQLVDDAISKWAKIGQETAR
jgi:hypothetical protein